MSSTVLFQVQPCWLRPSYRTIRFVSRKQYRFIIERHALSHVIIHESRLLENHLPETCSAPAIYSRTIMSHLDLHSVLMFFTLSASKDRSLDRRRLV